MNTKIALAATLALLWVTPSPAQTTTSEDFTQSATTNNWYYFNGACLTAGNSAGTGVTKTTAGSPPSCSNILSSYYQTRPDGDPVLVGGYNGTACTTSKGATSCASTIPDTVGQGALRFTNGYPYGHNESGAIVSAPPSFDAGQGVQITFKTVTYRGDNNGKHGADGISFYLIDATQFPSDPTTSPLWDGVGAYGGSLGYTCSNNNPPYEGLVGGYLGLGIDEYGNFLNGAALMPGYTGPNTATGDNAPLGYGYQPGRIGLRGAGSISFAWLTYKYPTQYPASLLTTPYTLPNGSTGTEAQYAVHQTCVTGLVWDFSTPAAPIATTTPVTGGSYAPIPNAYASLSNIAGEYAAGIYNRQQATPILYNLKITQKGLLTLSYSTGGAFSNILTGYDISTGNAPLPKNLYFGFAGSTGGATNIHEIMCFKAAPPDTSSASAALNQQLAAKVASNAQVYFSYYDPNNWTGTLTANGLVDTAGVLTINTGANWDAQCVLTGGSGCQNTGSTAVTTPLPAKRVMLTWNGNDNVGTPAVAGTAGIPFEWPGSTGITTNEQNAIDAGDSTPLNGNRLNYLRGDRTNEIDKTGAGLFRTRYGVLGDIVDSSPAWVGAPKSPYTQTWRDRYNLTSPAATPENTATTTYSTFKANEQGRLNVVYVGSNDGFLHGFRSGSEDVFGNLIDATTTPANSLTPNDGQEVLAYMPGAVLQTIHNSNPLLDPTNPQYAHNFFVDATPGTGDLFYGGQWYTWLVGGLGAGGSAIYALDITDASNFGESTTAAAATVKGEWSNASITCSNTTAPNAATCGTSMGNTYGTPLIRRLHNGTWGIIFGNGFGSATGDAGIFVASLDPTTAAPTFYYLSAGVGTAKSPSTDGISYVTASDLDGDHITDVVYAGDLLGNVWRFDLTSVSPSSWGVTSTSPIFSTPAGQPITTPIVISSSTIPGIGNLPAILLSFGTGQRTQLTTTTPLTYATGTQSLNTVWDWNFSTWNSVSAAQFASMTAAQLATAGLKTTTLGQANLQAQTLSVNSGTGVIDASNSPITWETCGSTSCSTKGSFGWYANLPGTSEQVVSPITLFQQALALNTTVPATNSVLSCTANTDTGMTYLLSVTGGGTFTSPGSTTPNSGFVNSTKDHNMVGVTTNLTGALSVVTTSENTTWLVGQGINPPSGSGTGTGTGNAKVIQPQQITLPPNISVNRQTWVQVR